MSSITQQISFMEKDTLDSARFFHSLILHGFSISVNNEEFLRRTCIFYIVQIDLTGKLMTISGGGVTDTYRTKQFHFHWGSEDRRGSEHDINDKHFPMEVGSCLQRHIRKTLLHGGRFMFTARHQINTFTWR